MKTRLMLSDSLWEKLEYALRRAGARITKGTRKIVEGILWRLRTGSPWRDLPPIFGPQSTVWNRFIRWSKSGVMREVFLTLRGEIDFEWCTWDSTYVRAHQHAHGAVKGTPTDLGKSRGGTSTKIHAASDSCGNLIDFKLSAGNAHDVTMADELLTMCDGAETILADKAYDSRDVRTHIKKLHAKPVIPFRETTKVGSEAGYDCDLYRLRHLGENLFCRPKQFRGLATRYDKTSTSYGGAVYLAGTIDWLKVA